MEPEHSEQTARLCGAGGRSARRQDDAARLSRRMPEAHRRTRRQHRRLRQAEQGRRAQGGRRLDRALARRQAAVADRRHADRDQGHHRNRRHADRPGLAHVGGPGVAPRFRERACVARSRRHHPRQDHHDGIRRHPSVAQDPEPARSWTHAGRLVERLVRRGRLRHGAGRTRHPGGRLDPAALELLRRGRLQAQRRRDQPQRLARSFQPELPGRHRRDLGRHLGGAARHRRPRRRRSGLRRALSAR